MRKILTFIVLSMLLYTHHLQAQREDQFIKTIVASDTILSGNTFEFRVIIKNLQGDFQPPSFADFDLVGGPNFSSNMQFVNGNMTKELSYTYYLKPRRTGLLYLGGASLLSDGKQIETAPLAVLILDNPEGITREYKIEYNSDNALFSPFQIREKEPTAKIPDRKLKKI